MTLSPRQIMAYLEFSERLDCVERANDFAITAVGSQGDKKAIDRMLKQLGG